MFNYGFTFNNKHDNFKLIRLKIHLNYCLQKIIISLQTFLTPTILLTMQILDLEKIITELKNQVTNLLKQQLFSSQRGNQTRSF